MNTDIHCEIQTQEAYVNKMQKEGVIVFTQQIPSKSMHELTQTTLQIKEKVMSKVSQMDRPLKTYSDIAERHLGRLDYRCGFTADIFEMVAQPIVSIIKNLSPTINFNYYWGVVTSLGNSEPTNMHRDVYPIHNTTKGVNLSSLDIHLPPYYFTVLIPLVKLTNENGPTQFIKTSHLYEVVDSTKAEKYAPLLNPGDFVIFDGRTLHKGLANTTTEERLVAYITFVANWYHDQTFTVNNYLFPELAVIGKA